MNNFPKVAASTISLAKRKLVYKVGTNDAWFTVKPKINGKQKTYKPYQIWRDMIKRCYDSTCQEKHPTYIGCKVCKDWLTFSVFEKWMLTQDWQEKQLDKDIIFQHNKVYAPKYCRFIPQALNKLLNGCDAARGDLPLGICWDKETGKYMAQISINGKAKKIGRFKTVPEAKASYNKAKYSEIHRHAMMQSDPAIREGLLNWVIE